MAILFLWFFETGGDDEVRDAVLVTDGDNEIGQVGYAMDFQFLVKIIMCNS